MIEGFETATFSIIGNVLSTSQAINGYHGITMNLRGAGSSRVDVMSNVVHHARGCDCGGEGAISVDTEDSMEATVNIVGNTVDHTLTGSAGIVISGPDGTSSLDANVFDNIVTASGGSAVRFPPHTASLHIVHGFNDFFNNAHPPDFGGYPTGTMNLAVNPQYVNPGVANYRLRVGSPLRDAGQTCSVGGLSRRDAGNRFRVGGRNVDIGAFELESGPVPPGVNVFGGPTGDTIIGTPGADIICGMIGMDTLEGVGGGDRLYGGQGGDDLVGGGGEDWLTGGPAPDDLAGGLGDDHLDGLDGAGGDNLDGGPGSDICLRDAGDPITGCP
jgi:hypothetical protein